MGSYLYLFFFLLIKYVSSQFSTLPPEYECFLCCDPFLQNVQGEIVNGTSYFPAYEYGVRFTFDIVRDGCNEFMEQSNISKEITFISCDISFGFFSFYDLTEDDITENFASFSNQNCPIYFTGDEFILFFNSVELDAAKVLNSSVAVITSPDYIYLQNFLSDIIPDLFFFSFGFFVPPTYIDPFRSLVEEHRLTLQQSLIVNYTTNEPLHLLLTFDATPSIFLEIFTCSSALDVNFTTFGLTGSTRNLLPTGTETCILSSGTDIANFVSSEFYFTERDIFKNSATFSGIELDHETSQMVLCFSGDSFFPNTNYDPAGILGGRIPAGV
eukprot:snap_masked-scaffold_42-processed-gene-2.21-mRNA-1 protein AED:1.00 eAED:1.00 QI:0/0/0/0/1/1/2/0/326